MVHLVQPPNPTQKILLMRVNLRKLVLMYFRQIQVIFRSYLYVLNISTQKLRMKLLSRKKIMKDYSN